MAVIDCGSLMYCLCIGIPFSASWIDLRSGEHEAVIADLHGFKRCIPFCDVGLVDSSITCGGIIFEADKNSSTLLKRLLIAVQCSELNWKISLQFIPSWNTSAHRV